jgi:hypothetical protein
MRKWYIDEIVYYKDGYYKVLYDEMDIIQDFHSIMESSCNISEFYDKLILFERQLKLNKIHKRDDIKEGKIIFEHKKPQIGFYGQLESKLMKK